MVASRLTGARPLCSQREGNRLDGYESTPSTSTPTLDHHPAGTRLEPSEFTETIIQGQGQRGILELCFPYTGKYMFHTHVSAFEELGWMVLFGVAD